MVIVMQNTIDFLVENKRIKELNKLMGIIFPGSLKKQKQKLNIIS